MDAADDRERPAGAKAPRLFGELIGTTEVVPFHMSVLLCWTLWPLGLESIGWVA